MSLILEKLFEETDTSARWEEEVYVTSGRNNADLRPHLFGVLFTGCRIGKRLWLCYALCVWTTSRRSVVRVKRTSRQPPPSPFSLLCITNPASQLAFLSPNSSVPGALAMPGLFSHPTTMYTGGGEKIVLIGCISLREAVVFV